MPREYKYACEILIEINDKINDPAGVAITHGLQQLGFDVQSTRLGKIENIVLRAPSIGVARERLEAIAKHEASPVMEHYSFVIHRYKKPKP